jgi:hypothetical protein
LVSHLCIFCTNKLINIASCSNRPSCVNECFEALQWPVYMLSYWLKHSMDRCLNRSKITRSLKWTDTKIFAAEHITKLFTG